MIDTTTKISTLKLAYELGIEERTGRMPKNHAEAAFLLIAGGKGGSTSIDELDMDGKVWSRLSDENRGINPQKAYSYAQFALGATVARLFLLKALENGTIANLASGIREGSNEEFADAFFGKKV
jgi:hypothetical protein